MISYTPEKLVKPDRILKNVSSAWVGIECGLESIVEKFCKQRKVALEFGVDRGYSTVALSNYFENVIGVDHFLGDQHSGKHTSFYETVVKELSVYPNIMLYNGTWQDFICYYDFQYDLIHIDVEHTYKETFPLARWAINHSSCVILHDILSFSDVMKAVTDVANEFKLNFYAWDDGAYGLGILSHL